MYIETDIDEHVDICLEKSNSASCSSFASFVKRKKFSTLQIPDSHFEKKNTQSEHIIAYFEYFFTCHYSKAV